MGRDNVMFSGEKKKKKNLQFFTKIHKVPNPVKSDVNSLMAPGAFWIVTITW